MIGTTTTLTTTSTTTAHKRYRAQGCIRCWDLNDSHDANDHPEIVRSTKRVRTRIEHWPFSWEVWTEEGLWTDHDPYDPALDH